MKHIRLFKIFENEIDWVGQRAFDYYSHRIDINLIIEEYKRLISNSAPLSEIRISRVERDDMLKHIQIMRLYPGH